MEENIITKSRKETLDFAKQFAKSLSGGEVLCLYGELGAGKTAFISGLINYYILGKRILSPTFTIVRHYYPLNSRISEILHIDLYRITNENEIDSLGFLDYMNKPAVIVAVEWAEKMHKKLPKKRIDISIETASLRKRKFKINKYD